MQPRYGSKDALQIGKLMYEEQNKWRIIECILFVFYVTMLRTQGSLEQPHQERWDIEPEGSDCPGFPTNPTHLVWLAPEKSTRRCP